MDDESARSSEPAYLFGNVYVPERIGIDATCVTVFGHRRQWLRVISLFGTVDVWQVPRELRGGYREIIDGVRKQQSELPG